MVNNIPVNGWPQLKDLEAVQPTLDRLDKIEAWKRTVKEETFTGDDITIENALALPARSLITSINAIQDLHGYDHPWAGGAYKNKLDFKAALDYWGADYTDNGDGSYTITRVGSGYSTPYQFATSPSVVSISAASIVSLTTGGNWRIEIFDETDGWKSISSATLLQVGVNANKIRLNYSNHGDGATISKVQIELGSSVTSFAPYSNICPISGRTEVGINDHGKNLVEDTIVGNIGSNGGIWEDAIYNMQIAKVKAGTTYVITTDDSAGAVYGFFTSKPQAGSTSYNGARVVSATKYFTAPINGYVAFHSNAGYTTPQCEVGTTPTSYVPYTGNVDATIQLGTTVYGADINWDTGVMTVTDVIGDGTVETIEDSYTNVCYGTLAKPNDSADKGTSIKHDTITNMFEVVNAPASGDGWDSTNNIGKLFCAASANRYWICFPKGKTLSDLQTITADTKICYKLATPTTLQLTPTQLELLKGYNRVTLSDGYGTIELKALTGANWS